MEDEGQDQNFLVCRSSVLEYFLPGWPTSFRHRSRFYSAAYISRLVVSTYEATGYLVPLVGVSPIREVAVDTVRCRRQTTAEARTTSIELRHHTVDGITEETAL